MSFRQPNIIAVNKAFEGTNFGPDGETEEGRLYLVADCILKNTCGFRSGSTIEAICMELDMMTRTRNPRNWTKQWAYIWLKNKKALDREAKSL